MGEKWYQGGRFDTLMRRAAGVLLLLATFVLLFGASALGVVAGAGTYLLLASGGDHVAGMWLGLLVGITAFAAGDVGRQHLLIMLVRLVLKGTKDNENQG